MSCLHTSQGIQEGDAWGSIFDNLGRRNRQAGGGRDDALRRVLHGDAESHYMHRRRSQETHLGTTIFWDEDFGTDLNNLLCLIPFYAHARTCMSAVCSQHVS